MQYFVSAYIKPKICFLDDEVYVEAKQSKKDFYDGLFAGELISTIRQIEVRSDQNKAIDEIIDTINVSPVLSLSQSGNGDFKISYPLYELDKILEKLGLYFTGQISDIADKLDEPMTSFNFILTKLSLQRRNQKIIKKLLQQKKYKFNLKRN